MAFFRPTIILRLPASNLMTAVNKSTLSRSNQLEINSFIGSHQRFFNLSFSPRFMPKVRHFSSQETTQQNICKVWVSKSQDIFANLALEHWLYSGSKNSPINHMIFWKNKPCVVVGRHQNPWAECNVHSCEMNNVQVARRNSGGGAVYHDQGNVCVSFFTERERYNRTTNLNVIVDAITKRWPVDLVVNERDDIILESLYKISGTAAKLGRIIAYHHCTLLLDVNKADLNHYLSTEIVGLACNATESVRANVKNLHEGDSSISFQELINVISREYCDVIKCEPQLSYVDPKSEGDFPGISEMEEEFKSWGWRFGRTPTFSIQRIFINPDLGDNGTLDLCIEVEKGCLSVVNLGKIEAKLQAHVQHLLLGKRFSLNIIEQELKSGLQSLNEKDIEIYKWIWRCFQKLFHL